MTRFHGRQSEERKENTRWYLLLWAKALKSHTGTAFANILSNSRAKSWATMVMKKTQRDSVKERERSRCVYTERRAKQARSRRTQLWCEETIEETRTRKRDRMK